MFVPSPLLGQAMGNEDTNISSTTDKNSSTSLESFVTGLEYFKRRTLQFSVLVGGNTKVCKCFEARRWKFLEHSQRMRWSRWLPLGTVARHTQGAEEEREIKKRRKTKEKKGH